MLGRVQWTEYKRLCDQPNFMSRHLLQVTARLALEAAKPALCKDLLNACDGDEAVALERPPDHRGDERSHMFKVEFSVDQVGEVLFALDNAGHQIGQASSGHRLVGPRAAWLEYRDWLAQQEI